MDEVIKILNDIKAGTSNRFTFLMGDEPYYIDIVSDYIEKNVLSEEEKDSIRPFCMVEMFLWKILFLQQTLSNDGGTSGGDCERSTRFESYH
jgi:hypothetical protein